MNEYVEACGLSPLHFGPTSGPTFTSDTCGSMSEEAERVRLGADAADAAGVLPTGLMLFDDELLSTLDSAQTIPIPDLGEVCLLTYDWDLTLASLPFAMSEFSWDTKDESVSLAVSMGALQNVHGTVLLAQGDVNRETENCGLAVRSQVPSSGLLSVAADSFDVRVWFRMRIRDRESGEEGPPQRVSLQGVRVEVELGEFVPFPTTDWDWERLLDLPEEAEAAEIEDFDELIEGLLGSRSDIEERIAQHLEPQLRPAGLALADVLQSQLAQEYDRICSLDYLPDFDEVRIRVDAFDGDVAQPGVPSC